VVTRLPCRVAAPFLLSLSLALRAGSAFGAGANLYWEESAGLHCPTPEQLRWALETHLGTNVRLRHGNPSTGERGLYLGSGPRGTLHLWLWTTPAEIHHDRELPVEDVPCAQRAEAIALIADAWLKALPSTGDDGTDRGPSLSPSGTGKELPSASPSPVPRSAPSPTSSAATESISAGNPVTARDAVPKRGFALELRGAALGVFGIDSAAFGVGGAFALDFWIGRFFGFGTQLEIATSLVGSDSVVAGAQVTVRRQALSVYGSFRPNPTQLPGLAVLAGAQLQRLDARATGYPVNGGEVALPVAAWAGVSYRWEIVRRVELFGQFEGSLGFSKQHFFVTGPPGATRTLVTTPAVSAAFLMGVVVDLL
jgi:hypothetical protein